MAAPGAPVLNSATGGNAQVALVWTAPASDGGSAIIQYNVYRDGVQVSPIVTRPFAAPVTSGTVSITVSDLTGATDMRAQIQAQLTTNARIWQFPASGTIRIDGRLTIWSKNNVVVDLRACSIRHSASTAGAATSNNASVFDVYDSTDIKIYSSTANGDLRGANPNPGSLGIDPYPENDYGHMVNINDSVRIEVDHLTSQGAWGDFVSVADDLDGARLRTTNIWVHHITDTNTGRSFISILNGTYIYFEDCTLGQAGLQVFNIEPYQTNVNIHHVYFRRNGGTQDYAHVVSGANFGYWANLGNGTLGGTIADIYLEDNTCSAKVMQTILTQNSTPRRARFYIRRNTSTFASSTPLYGHGAVIDMRYIDTLYIESNIQNGPPTSHVETSVTDFHYIP